MSADLLDDVYEGRTLRWSGPAGECPGLLVTRGFTASWCTGPSGREALAVARACQALDRSVMRGGAHPSLLADPVPDTNGVHEMRAGGWRVHWALTTDGPVFLAVCR